MSQQARSHSPGLVLENPYTISNDNDEEDDRFPFLDLNEKVVDNYLNAEEPFHDLHAQFKGSTHVDFHDTFPINDDVLITQKEHTHMLAEELWKVTGGWRHETLRPLEEYHGDLEAVAILPVEGRDEYHDSGGEGDAENDKGGSADEDEGDDDEGTHQHDGCMFEEALMDEISLITEFTASLKHQAQFCD